MNNIDAVKTVRDIREKMQEQLQGKSKDEVNDYFREHSQWAFQGVARRQPDSQKASNREQSNLN